MFRTIRAAGLAAAVLGFTLLAVNGDPIRAGEGEYAPQAHYLDHASAEMTLSADAVNAVEPDPVSEAAGEFATRAAQLAYAAVPRPRALDELVVAYGRTETEDEEQDCLANAVYFEARGEPIIGQLAVAEVVLNRAASERYPETICDVVLQPWQFSFVNATGRIPRANRASEAWRKSVAIARIAQAQAAGLLDTDVLWYHADYVAPSWGKRLNRQTKVGLHIFYS